MDSPIKPWLPMRSSEPKKSALPRDAHRAFAAILQQAEHLRNAMSADDRTRVLRHAVLIGEAAADLEECVEKTAEVPRG